MKTLKQKLIDIDQINSADKAIELIHIFHIFLGYVNSYLQKLAITEPC